MEPPGVGMSLRLPTLILMVLVAGCSPSAGGKKAAGEDEALPPPTYQLALPEGLRKLVDEPYKGDFDGMVKRRMIRVAAPFSRTYYFVDTGNLKIHLVMLPIPRDMQLSALNSGRVDMVASQLTITPERKKFVDFSRPTRTGVNEIVVSGPGSQAISSPEQLSGKQLFVRRSSSYFQSLQALNGKLAAQGKDPVK